MPTKATELLFLIVNGAKMLSQTITDLEKYIEERTKLRDQLCQELNREIEEARNVLVNLKGGEAASAVDSLLARIFKPNGAPTATVVVKAESRQEALAEILPKYGIDKKGMTAKEAFDILTSRGLPVSNVDSVFTSLSTMVGKRAAKKVKEGKQAYFFAISK